MRLFIHFEFLKLVGVNLGVVSNQPIEPSIVNNLIGNHT